MIVHSRHPLGRSHAAKHQNKVGENNCFLPLLKKNDIGYKKFILMGMSSFHNYLSIV